ncbi:lysis system i-spanin subunit Rz [Pseudomonas putida]|uniref:Bacteriophage lysis protein n=1 Tax=Pseudomonas putida TaxID=303 RepID=A0A1B2FDY1_PSEPU|nr:lysis system i-spanin subunit Rz [Pseudomonas putida]ANY90438.1 Bacteriophage lysis protein [Pseudomonas putida]
MTPSPLRILLLSVLPIVVMALVINLLLQRLDTVQEERDQALKDRDAVIQIANTTARNLATAAGNDMKHTQELSHALNDNQDLRRAVADRDKRLLIRANCPAVRTDSAGAGLADAGTAELAADARPDYFTLRDQLALSKQMILGLQDHVRSFCTTQPTTTGARP